MIYILLNNRNVQRNPTEMSTDSIPVKVIYESFEDDSVFKTNNEHILNHKKGPNSDIRVSPIREPGTRKLDWGI